MKALFINDNMMSQKNQIGRFASPIGLICVEWSATRFTM